MSATMYLTNEMYLYSEDDIELGDKCVVYNTEAAMLASVRARLTAFANQLTGDVKVEKDRLRKRLFRTTLNEVKQLLGAGEKAYLKELQKTRYVLLSTRHDYFDIILRIIPVGD